MTVAVIDPAIAVDPRFLRRLPDDFRVEWFSGTGGGGQHRNKHQNSCRLIHVPTGMVAQAQCRSRQNSQQEAMAALTAQLDARARGQKAEKLDAARKEQVGSGMRGDKTRTYREQDGIVTDHGSGRKVSLRQVLAGKLELLW